MEFKSDEMEEPKLNVLQNSQSLPTSLAQQGEQHAEEQDGQSLSQFQESKDDFSIDPQVDIPPDINLGDNDDKITDELNEDFQDQTKALSELLTKVGWISKTHKESKEVLKMSKEILAELKSNQRIRSLELLGRSLSAVERDLLDKSLWKMKAQDAETLCHMLEGFAIKDDEVVFLPYTIPEILAQRKKIENLYPFQKTYCGMSHGNCLDYSKFNENDKSNWSTIRSRIMKWVCANNTDYFICLDLLKKYRIEKRNKKKFEEERFKLNLELFLAGRKEGDSYRRFCRDVYRRTLADSKRGPPFQDQDAMAINDSEYFVHKCCDALQEIIGKVLTETLLKWDPVTDAKPEFWLSLDGLTLKRRTGDAVVLTTFVGGDRIDFTIELKEMKSGSTGIEIVHLVQNALASVGIRGRSRIIANWVGAVVDGAEIGKLDFLLVEKLSGSHYSTRSDLPSAVPLVWDPCHQLERIYRRLCSSVKFFEAQLNLLAELRGIYSIGLGRYTLANECSKEGAKFFVTMKDASTRWIAHQELIFKNHLKTLPQQKRCLLKAKKKKTARKALSKEMTSAINVALLIILIDCIKVLRDMSISGQDREQVPWEYPRQAQATLDAFKAMNEDLKVKGTAQEKFKRFPVMLENLCILKDFKLPYRVKEAGKELVKNLVLNEENPSWVNPKV